VLEPKAVVQVGQKVKAGEILADGAATYKGELALGRNVFGRVHGLGRFTTLKTRSSSAKTGAANDVYTSIHIEEFEIEIRETKRGREEFTRDDSQRLPEKALAQSRTTMAWCRSAPMSSRATSWWARVAPKSKSELTPEEEALARDLRPGW